MDVIQPGEQFSHVKVVVVSSTGAGGTKIEIGFGVGVLVRYMLRHVLSDHDKQEHEFKTRMGSQKDRLLIVRPTALTDGKENGDIAEFLATERAPTARVDRADVATWILDAVCNEGTDSYFGKEISLSAKK